MIRSVDSAAGRGSNLRTILTQKMWILSWSTPHNNSKHLACFDDEESQHKCGWMVHEVSIQLMIGQRETYVYFVV